MIKVLILLLLAVTSNPVLGQLGTENCYPTMEDAEEDKYYTSEEFTITSTWNGVNKNKIYDYTFSYKIFEIGDNPDDEGSEVDVPIDTDTIGVMRLPEFSLTPGNYRIEASANPKSFMDTDYHMRCFLIILPENPRAHITGGPIRTVAENTNFLMDGRESKNFNIPDEDNEKENKGLSYYWTCTQNTTPPTYCKSGWYNRKSKFTVPKKYVVVGESFNFTLEVATEWDTYNSTSQIIWVKKNSANIVIVCKKNCAPLVELSDIKSSTFLEAKCISSCEDINDNNYGWQILEVKTRRVLQFDYKKHTRYGQNNRKLIINENAMKPGRYVFGVAIKVASGKTGAATIELTFGGQVEITECYVYPEKGESLITQFTFKCLQGPNERNFYEVDYIDTKDPSVTKHVLDGYYPSVFKRSFVLTPSKNKKLEITISKTGRQASVFNPKVVVTSSLKNKNVDEIIRQVNKVYNGDSPEQSVRKLANSSDPENKKKAVHIVSSLVEELVGIKLEDKKFNDFINHLKRKATNDILNTELETIPDVLKVTDSLTALNAYKNPETTDPDLALLMATICKKMAEEMVSKMNQEQRQPAKAQDAKLFSKFMSRCYEVHGNPNNELLSPMQLNITTENITNIEAPDISINENYPDYKDFDEKYYEHLEKFKNSTTISLTAASKTAKVTALTTVTGEGILKSHGKSDVQVVLKSSGNDMAKTNVSGARVLVIPSQDFANDNHSYDLLMNVFKKDIMWWNPKNTHVATPIAKIQFWHSTCKKRIREFKKPVEIYFERKKHFTFPKKYMEDVLIASENCTINQTKKHFSCMKVYQFAIPRRVVFHLKFANVSMQNALKFAITYFKYPSSRDFINSTIIEDKNITTKFINKENYTVLVYLAIKPHVYIPAKITYTIESLISLCVQWEKNTSQWQPACYPGSNGNETVINCNCFHFSTLAGYFQNIEGLPKSVLTTNIELQIVPCYVVFYTVFATLSLFYILSIFVMFMKKKSVYYLSDNNTKHAFAYVLTVKTGMKPNAGTTSNVVIKLIGKKSTSDPHVLNYPDPKKALLQSFGEDVFLLATESSLGALTEIELWIDSIGVSPNWYCQDIYVYDLQENKEWQFKVRTSFSVLKGVTHQKIKATKRISKKEGKFKINLSQKFHSWYICQNEEQLSYLKKLTVVLSTILTIYILVFFTFEWPKFQLNDVLDSVYKVSLTTYHILVAIGSSFISFVFHTIITWCFRCSKLQSLRGKKKDKSIKLPYIVTVFCWLLLIFIIATSTCILIFIGFWLPYYSSLTWLTICLIGICFDIFIYNPILAIIENHIFKQYFHQNINKMFQHFLHTAEKQRKYLNRRFGQVLFRPYFEHLYKPLRKKQTKKLKRRLEHRTSVISEFDDLIMFGIYIIILYVVILSNKDSLLVHSEHQLTDQIEGVTTRTLSFTGLTTMRGIYEYINETLIKIIHPTWWYEGFLLRDPGIMIDDVNKYIGVVRIRQQRVQKNLCNVTSKMKFLNTTCWTEYSLMDSEKKSFGTGWKEEINSVAVIYNRLHNIWNYQSSSETGSFGGFGEFTTYSGGGYVHYLGRTLYNSIANLLAMVRDKWIDGQTRVTFVEFMTYNPNYNIFNSVTLTLEKSATGYVTKEVYVSAARMLFVKNEVEQMSSVFFFLFVVWVVVLFFKHSIGTFKKIHNFFKDLWLLIDLVILFMSLMSIGLFIIRMYLVGRYLRRLEQVKHNQFIEYFYLFHIEYFLNFTAAFLVCISTIRLWKFLRFASMFRTLEKTIIIASSLLLSFSTVVIVQVLLFAFPIMLLLGNYFTRIRTTTKLIRLMLTMPLRPIEMRLREFISYKFAMFLFSLYLIAIMINMFIFIMFIVISYFEAQLEMSSEKQEYNIRTYVQEKSLYLPRYLKYKYKYSLRGGTQKQSKVVPKSHKLLYSKCRSISASRMNKMTSIVHCLLRNQKMYKKPRRLSKNDIKLMLQVCREISRRESKQDVDIFFIGKIQQQERIQLIDEKRVEKVANVANILLQEELPEFTKEKLVNKKLESCRKAIKQKQKTLQKCNLMLKLTLEKLNNAEEQFMKKFQINM